MRRERPGIDSSSILSSYWRYNHPDLYVLVKLADVMNIKKKRSEFLGVRKAMKQ